MVASDSISTSNVVFNSLNESQTRLQYCERTWSRWKPLASIDVGPESPACSVSLCRAYTQFANCPSQTCLVGSRPSLVDGADGYLLQRGTVPRRRFRIEHLGLQRFRPFHSTSGIWPGLLPSVSGDICPGEHADSLMGRKRDTVDPVWGANRPPDEEIGGDTRDIGLFLGRERERIARRVPHPAIPSLETLRAFQRSLAQIGLSRREGTRMDAHPPEGRSDGF